MHARKLWLWAALVGGCGDAGGAAQGQETGPCLDGMCLGALECRSDVCVDPSGGATEPEPTPTTGTTMTGPCEPGTTGCQCIIGGCETGNECVENLCEARVYTTTSLGGNGSHTCVTLGGGEVRCWGSNAYSILGVMTDEYTYGDDELARDTPLVDVGAAALQVDAGARHSCALLEGGAVRCWGDNWFGQLGYGHVDNIGDDETPASQPVVQLGGPAVEVQVGEFHSCALMEDRTVRCWGQHPFTGQGSYDDVGDDEHPSAYPAVDIGGPVEELAVGDRHSCARLAGGKVRCWGQDAAGSLGYGSILQQDAQTRTPREFGDLALGGPATQLAVGGHHACALMAGGAVRCWGYGESGVLGYGKYLDGTPKPEAWGDVPLAEPATAVFAGLSNTCTLHAGGVVRCWGDGLYGMNGNLSDAIIGDDEPASVLGPIAVGGEVVAGTIGAGNVCVLLSNKAVRCWGIGDLLGYGNESIIGDNEAPEVAGDVPIE